MPITRSDLLVFSTGMVAGVLAYKTYPKWKDKVTPLLSEAAAGVIAAMKDVATGCEQPAGPAVHPDANTGSNVDKNEPWLAGEVASMSV